MNIRELGPTWALAYDIILGSFLLSWAIVGLLAIKKKWNWLIYPEYNPFARILGKEFLEVVVLLTSILGLLAGFYLVIKAGLQLF